MRRLGILATIVLVASGFTAVTGTPAGASPGDHVPNCSLPSPPPCMLSFARDGVGIFNESQYKVVWNEEDPAHGFYSVEVQKFNGASWDPAMGAGEMGHRFTISINF